MTPVERVMIWQKNNPERHAQNQANWRKRYPHKHCEQQSRRRARIKEQLCTCCTKEDILPIYIEAQELNMTVDHIIAIANGGLHCANNLQLLTKSENSSKGVK